MPEVIVRKGEPVDRALKRLKSKLDAEGILDEVRRLRAFETPNQRAGVKPKPTPNAAGPSFGSIQTANGRSPILISRTRR